MAESTPDRKATAVVNLEAALGLKIPPILFEGDVPVSLESIGPGSKFALGHAKDPAIEPEEAKLPASYGTGRLWLAARAPHGLYAHWDLAPQQQQHYNDLAMDHHLAVRVHLADLKNRPLIEVQLHPESRHWFIPVAFAGKQYFAELGYYQTGQGWKSVAVSEAVATPPEGVTQDKTVRFATVPTLPLDPHPASNQPAPVKPAEASANPQNESGIEAPVPGGASEPGSKPGTLVRVPEPEANIGSAPQGWLESGSHAQPAAQISFEPGLAPVPDWTTAQEEAFAEIMGWTLEGPASPNAAGVIDFLGYQLSSIEAARLEPPIPSGLLISVPSLPSGQQVSSPAGGELPPQKSFWLSVNAELVIFGATEPNAQVTIGGRPIQLRPDGSFSYHVALPDGHHEVSIVAASAHGDLRRADLEFYRGTSYQGEVRPHPQGPDVKKPDA